MCAHTSLHLRMTCQSRRSIRPAYTKLGSLREDRIGIRDLREAQLCHRPCARSAAKPRIALRGIPRYHPAAITACLTFPCSRQRPARTPPSRPRSTCLDNQASRTRTPHTFKTLSLTSLSSTSMHVITFGGSHHPRRAPSISNIHVCYFPQTDKSTLCSSPLSTDLNDFIPP